MALSLGLAGCGTLHQAHQPDGPALYGGVRLILEQLGHERAGVMDVVFYCLDLPFSFVGDVCMSPLAYLNEIERDGVEVRAEDPRRLGAPRHVR